MTETKTDKEPSIEEILESIRQIISEDAPAAEKAGPGVDLSVKPEAPLPPGPEDDILELTDVVADVPLDLTPVAENSPADKAVPLDLTPEAEPAPSTSDLDLSAQPEPVMTDTAGPLLSDAAADAATSALSKLLSTNVAVETETPGRVGPVTLEEMARDLMRPLIKSWLDQNLPGVIEKLVQKELEKISRRAGG